VPTLSVRETRALISIGTNSTRLLVLRGDQVQTARSLGTRLGTKLDEMHVLDPDARGRTLGAVGEYTAIVREAGATLDVVATSALRRADDATTFIADVRRTTGVELRVLSGDEEATFSFLGATQGLKLDAALGDVGVLDVGGGSTELAVGSGATVAKTISLEIGAVRLGERVPALLGGHALDAGERAAAVAEASALADAVLAPLAAFRGVARLIAVGGTMFTAAAMLAQNPERDGVIVTGGDRRGLIDALLSRDLAGRKKIRHIRPQRADILPAGLIVADRACRFIGRSIAIVSHSDLLLGYATSTAYRALAPAGRR
jgi:exopolyphosphatase/guanosine-5'-triphosphate,3'-diphosphate pyrophosphatase